MEELRYKAEYDTLTGIPNKSTFFRETEKMLKLNPGTKYVLLRLDVERFKVINDLYGIEAGDNLLINIANTMRDIFSEIGTYAHLESDNFIACFPYDENKVKEITTKITESQKSFIPDFEIVIAYGCYIISDPETKVTLMSDRAYLALCQIKGMYLNRIGYYDDSLMSKVKSEQQIVNDMNEALTDNQFVVYFQPQFDHKTGKIVSAEALSRWIHPTKNMISPGVFIPTFEKNGFIVKLDEYIWNKACEWQAKWIKENPDKEPFPISVNISRLDIYNPHLCEILLSIIKKYGISADLFRLEITESAYVENPSQLIQTIECLRSSGFIVEMDDFGSGYSSLNSLKDVPVDVLKLDLCFLSGENRLRRSEQILVSIVEMSKKLNLKIIAEGVETKEQADFLTSIGCSIIQGFYYSRPVPIEEFEKLLSQN